MSILEVLVVPVPLSITLCNEEELLRLKIIFGSSFRYTSASDILIVNGCGYFASLFLSHKPYTLASVNTMCTMFVPSSSVLVLARLTAMIQGEATENLVQTLIQT